MFTTSNLVSPAVDFLRARLEESITLPAAIAVVSARPRDGKSYTAHCLASAFARAGASAVLIDATSRSRGSLSVGSLSLLDRVETQIASLKNKPMTNPSYARLNLTADTLRKSPTAAEVAAIRSACVSNFDVAIIDTDPMLESTLALLFTANADSIVVTVRQGRRLNAADESLRDALSERDCVNLVMVDARVIDRFNTNDAPDLQNETFASHAFGAKNPSAAGAQQL